MYNGGTQKIVGPESKVHGSLARLEGAVLEVVAGAAKDWRINACVDSLVIAEASRGKNESRLK